MNSRRKKQLGVIAVLAVIAIAVAGLRAFVLQPYIIPSNSMEPTLVPGDRILTNKLAYASASPVRGDVVVFAYPKDPSHILVKRVLGCEGETIELKDNMVLINGTPIQEPYLKSGDYPPFGPEKIPAGNVFVLGDNRNESEDSRDWGLLPKSYILGKVWTIYFPLNRIRQL